MSNQENANTIFNTDLFEHLTGELPDTASGENKEKKDDIGERIKAVRKSKGLSIKELSLLTGFSEDFIQGLENNTISPQIGQLLKLSRSLDTNFGSILSGGDEKSYSITRIGERKTVIRSTGQKESNPVYRYMSLGGEAASRKMEPFIVELESDAKKEMSVHNGEEFIFVLSGVVLLDIQQETIELNPGDSAYYHSTTPHFLKAKEGKASILAVVTR